MGKGEFAGLLSAAGAATAIGGVYKAGEFLHRAKKLKDVGPANAVYVRLIKRVRADLDEVKRLLTVPEIKNALEANPAKAKWIYGAMRDVRGALENIKPHTERVAGDIEDGRRVGLRHRVYWLFSEKEKLENRVKEVETAHASLTEVIGFLTGLEPVVQKEKEKRQHLDEPQGHNTKIDVDIRHEHQHQHPGPQQHQRVEEREVWLERHDRGPRHVVEETRYVEHEHAAPPPPPRRYSEREVYVERRDPRHEERYYEDRHYDARLDSSPSRGAPIEERDLYVQRDPRDPGHIEAQYYERGPGYYDTRRYSSHEHRYSSDGAPARRPESFEDRVPDRETWMQSDARGPSSARPRNYGEYAEYGAPQPSGAAEYHPSRRFHGDAGFGDDLVLNPQPVPLQPRDFEREVSSYAKYNGYGRGR